MIQRRKTCWSKGQQVFREWKLSSYNIEMVQVHCRHFNGYRPCGLNEICSESCPRRDLIEQSVLIVHLGALGAVLRSTALLKAIHLKYPRASLTWVTDSPADQLLRQHPLIDRVLTTSSESLLQLSALEFDTAFVIDKSLKAAGVLAKTKARQAFGFSVDKMSGAMIPATPAADELWRLGLSNQIKFFSNQKSEVQLLQEALELSSVMGEGQIGEYNLPLTSSERAASQTRQRNWTLYSQQPVIGINTGCGSVLLHKKLSIEGHRELIQRLLQKGSKNIVLLGGPEDTERNQQIGQGLPVIQSATQLGLRDGLVSVAACDVVITGDSLGMHMAISQKKYVTVWFGPTCSQEIELYGRGDKIQTWASCAPCWKRSCEELNMCYDQVDFSKLISSVEKGIRHWEKQEQMRLAG